MQLAELETPFPIDWSSSGGVPVSRKSLFPGVDLP
jgi:hypothetical protein